EFRRVLFRSWCASRNAVADISAAAAAAIGVHAGNEGAQSTNGSNGSGGCDESPLDKFAARHFSLRVSLHDLRAVLAGIFGRSQLCLGRVLRQINKAHIGCAPL